MPDITSYLTKSFLKRALENGLKIPNIEIDEFVVSPASGKGENYTSELLRVCVDYKIPQQGSQQISLIMKKVLTHVAEGTLSHADVAGTEINTYVKLIPEMENLLGNSTVFAPKCFLADKEAQILVMADLKSQGYTVQDRITGLDEVHCTMVMKKIAQYHASSMFIVKTKPKYADIFNKAMINEFTAESGHLWKIFIFNFELLIGVMKSWPGYEPIVGKLKKIRSNLLERLIEQCKRKEGELRVINHGDFWVNNIMFKYKTGSNTPLDLAFVDLQFSHFGSFGIDLQYFLYSSVQFDVLKTKRSVLLKAYYDTLKSTLEQLKYSPIPSWEQVCEEMRAKEFFGLFSVCCIRPFVTMDKSASGNNTFETMFDDSQEKIHAMFGSESTKEILKYSLKRFDELGVLDE